MFQRGRKNPPDRIITFNLLIVGTDPNFQPRPSKAMVLTFPRSSGRSRDVVALRCAADSRQDHGLMAFFCKLRYKWRMHICNLLQTLQIEQNKAVRQIASSKNPVTRLMLVRLTLLSSGRLGIAPTFCA